ncbi:MULTISPECIES: hypothetical protein [unclassified Chelatococcus]|nr:MULTISPECIES: hypothetical protein [unclassified Chelatococcus]MBS7701611.1 hypothetical protein [Chelatococcus sp. YT9]MBX3559681.1 hypothetical protein [Chelatococcus sp.]
MEQRSLFGLSEHLEKLSKIGDPLEVLEGLGYGDTRTAQPRTDRQI